MTAEDVMVVSRHRQAGARVNEREKRLVGEQLEPGGRPKAPGRLELLQRFVNTWNHDFPLEWDRIGTPTSARAWLRSKGLIRPTSPVTAADVGRLRRLREAVRSLAKSRHGDRRPPRAAVGVLREEGERTRLAIAFDGDGRAASVPADAGVDGAIATLLAIVHEAQIVGTWDRMTACRRCEYLFYDRSKNRSAAWCAMAICGNRTKNRAYRRRLATRAAT
jgi:predicted RNA-binding Zn ribbon-like protein